jgi:hypothetical protein
MHCGQNSLGFDKNHQTTARRGFGANNKRYEPVSISFTSIGSAIGSALSGVGASLTSVQQTSLVQSMLNLFNPNEAQEKVLLGKMASFVHTMPSMVPEFAMEFSKIADPALVGAISPLMTLPLPSDAISQIEAVEQMVQQGL